jgi:hypothetical protein
MAAMEVISHKELTSIFGILSAADSLESCWVSFGNAFSKSDYFRLCCGMATLYVDGVLSKEQRLIVVFLLFAVYRNEQENHNQFLVLLEEHAVVGESMIDCWLISVLLKSPDIMLDIAKKSPGDLVAEFATVPAEEAAKISITAMLEKHQHVEPPKLSAYATSSVRCVISAPVAGSADTPEWAQEEILEESKTLSAIDSSTYSCELKPDFVRWAPPTMDVMSEELQWIDGDDASCLLWDDTLTKSLSEEEQIRQTFAAALSNPLSPVKQQMLASKLKEKPEVPTVAVGRSGSASTAFIVSPQQLPRLIENNSSVAIEYVLKMMQTPQAEEYLNAIVSMEMSFHSIEVVNGLSVLADFSSDFIRAYISKCLLSCENTKDKFIQVRLFSIYTSIGLVCIVMLIFILTFLYSVLLPTSRLTESLRASGVRAGAVAGAPQQPSHQGHVCRAANVLLELLQD